jgi:hypothetical protein
MGCHRVGFSLPTLNMSNSVFHPFFLLWGRRTFFPARHFLFLAEHIINRDQCLDLHWILKGVLQTFHINLLFFWKRVIEFFSCLRNSLFRENTLIGKKTVATRIACADTFVREVMAFQDRFRLVFDTCCNSLSFPFHEVGHRLGLDQLPFFSS